MGSIVDGRTTKGGAHAFPRSMPTDFVAAHKGFLDPAIIPLYIVHMKRVTASEARRNWFQLLDEVAQGERIVIERRGRRIVVLCEDLTETGPSEATPDYSKLLQVPNAEEADLWSWSWSEDGLELQDKS